MLEIIIPAETDELWDEEKQEFITIPAKKAQTLQLEHSLISLSRWESKWCKPFHSKTEKTEEEIIDYIRCMTLNKNVDQSVYNRLGGEQFKQITDYIYAPMTATTVNDGGGKRNNEAITSELIYYWMISQNIPLECEKWHLNRLITLIRVCAAKNSPPQKYSNKEIASRYAALNAERRARHKSKG